MRKRLAYDDQPVLRRLARPLGGLLVFTAVEVGVLTATYVDPTGFGGVQEPDGLEGLAAMAAIFFAVVGFVAAITLIAADWYGGRRFTAPPGWPTAPERWRPPSGWQPDPTWPTAPSGWKFWTYPRIVGGPSVTSR